MAVENTADEEVATRKRVVNLIAEMEQVQRALSVARGDKDAVLSEIAKIKKNENELSMEVQRLNTSIRVIRADRDRAVAVTVKDKLELETVRKARSTQANTIKQLRLQVQKLEDEDRGPDEKAVANLCDEIEELKALVKDRSRELSVISVARSSLIDTSHKQLKEIGDRKQSIANQVSIIEDLRAALLRSDNQIETINVANKNLNEKVAAHLASTENWRLKVEHSNKQRVDAENYSILKSDQINVYKAAFDLMNKQLTK